jgi:mono/diheme cytochrome c family protein
MALARFAVALMVAGTAPAMAAPTTPLFTSRCGMCHQPDAAGLPGQFPRLAGRSAAIAAAPGGRRYLALVLLRGMFGKIDVDGRPLTGMMPSMGTMKDQEIADLLTHVTQLPGAGKPAKKIAPFTAAEIAKVRAEPSMTAQAVGAERAKLASTAGFPN